MLAARVKLPSISTLNGPVVIGVTSVLATVTTIVFKVSLSVTFNIILGVVAVATNVGPSFTASIISTGNGVLVDVLFPGVGSASVADIVAVLA